MIAGRTFNIFNSGAQAMDISFDQLCIENKLNI